MADSNDHITGQTMMSGCEDPTTKPATKEKLEEYRKSLHDLMVSAKAKVKESKTKHDSANATLIDRDLCFDWTKHMGEKYRTLALGTSTANPPDDPDHVLFGTTTLEKDASETKILINDLAAKDKKDLDVKLVQVRAELKNLHNKVKAVTEAFCAVEAEIGNNCNSAQLDLLRSEIGDHSCIKSTLTTKHFDRWIDTICDNVRDAISKVNTEVNHGIQVASINALADFANLNDAAKSLEDSFKALNKDVSENVDALEAKLKAERSNVNAAQIALSEKWFDLRIDLLAQEALNRICEFAKAPECLISWKDIGKEVKELICATHSEDMGCNDDDDEAQDGAKQYQGKGKKTGYAKLE